jgi:hypothetical protein
MEISWTIEDKYRDRCEIWVPQIVQDEKEDMCNIHG